MVEFYQRQSRSELSFGGSILKIKVCEDEKEQQERINLLIKKYADINCWDLEIDFFETDEDFWMHRDEKADIVFLDIYLKNGNGIEIARKLRQLEDDCAIVFITSSRSHAIEGFELKAQHYITKPVSEEQVFEALKRCEQMVNEDGRSIRIPSGKLMITVRLKDIIYAEVFDKLCILHTVNEDVKIHMPLSQLEQELGGSPFLRCHRCSIINMNQVADYTNDCFVMKNDHEVAIRRNGSVEIRQVYLDFIFNKIRGKHRDVH